MTKHINYLSNLTELNLCNNNIGNDGLFYLLQNIDKIQKIRLLDISYNYIDDYGINILINNLYKLPDLKILNFRENNIRLKRKIYNKLKNMKNRIILFDINL